MSEFMEGLNLTVLGVTIVFMVLSILAVVLYFVGWSERRLVEKEAPAPAPTAAAREEKPAIPPRDLAVVTAAVLAYTAEKAAQLRPLPFRRKVSDAWRLYGVQSSMEEVEDFNYEIGKW
ncbi:methylmalonyl-CoA epimerase [Thermococcus celericrescens]|uniref:Methylmalonyl-CoA epimerase n=2 Tax=Thermococcus TaxID=2263 RepID=A0A117ISQ2_9EURY|nr:MULTISPECIES: OadG family transporter subunit [Thermococcus]KUH31762.1 methylmalonyl-CoA epimerase [Thermococcus celericrescens]QEK15868.1 methylmalonyl-CoA epimerase [Thermococcus aciditolerans]